MDNYNENQTEEKFDGSTLSDDVGKVFKSDPKINVISKEEFELRVNQVFNLLWKTLSKSFGPYGAPTIIYNYPWSHVTKDGYTIMKNLSMNAAETKVDQAIADMASDICGRLNYTVGDGTTSAVIATNSIYQNYLKNKDFLNRSRVLPRDVIKKYDKIKERIISGLNEYICTINHGDKNQLAEGIKKIVYISSNGDELITEYIYELYKELGTPAISCSLAPDGITKKRLIEGYKYDLMLNDRLYINSDDDKMYLSNADVIIFATKITKDTYNNILKPLNDASRVRGRHLIVCAPSYDEVALNQVIAVDLNNEYRKTHDVNMVLTSYRAVSAHARRLVNDFAILMGTTVIDRALEQRIKDHIASGLTIESIISIDHRDVKGIKKIGYNSNNQPFSYIYGEDEIPEGCTTHESMIDLDENYITLGYTGSCSLGLKSSLFTEIYYDKNMYDAAVKEAASLLRETEDKYKKLGTFNIEVAQAQERLYALNLKMGVIEVGADSELSQKMLKDAVDDAIKAAASAYRYGYVLGCNVDMLRTIKKIYEKENDAVTKILLKILFDGFKDVYKTVLLNAFEDEKINVDLTIKNADNNNFDSLRIKREIEDIMKRKFTGYNNIFNAGNNVLMKTIEDIKAFGDELTVHNLIIYYSINTGMVLDVSEFKYSNSVINSSQTDEEILKATIDLISLLITGNQMVVTQKHNF